MKACSFVVIAAIAGAGCADREPVAPRTANVTVAAPPAASASSSARPEVTPAVTRHGMHAVSLRGVAPAFAKYLNAIHARIHPEFTDKELKKLDALPADDPSNDKKLVTRIELVVRAVDGSIASATVTKPSGVEAFDDVAVESVRRAAPFGAAPDGIASADGNVYVDWELAREEIWACSTMHARPYLFAR